MFFFWKKKPKQDATVATKLEAKTKPVKAPKPKKPEPPLEVFTTWPKCPKCSLSGSDLKPSKYCKGKRFFIFRCEHGHKVEHLHTTCKCGFSWASQCRPVGFEEPKKDAVAFAPPPRELTELEKADQALRYFFEVELCAGEGFYDELKALMIGSENLPAGMFADVINRDKRHQRLFYEKIEGSSEI